MSLSLSLDAKEVLFHLNYMGYRNVSKEQLKFFMLGKISACWHWISDLKNFFVNFRPKKAY